MINVYINKRDGWITIGDTRSQNLPDGWTVNLSNIRRAMKLYREQHNLRRKPLHIEYVDKQFFK